ncbi:MAG TPA: GNAT family N-acetyltransferase [Bacteroidota bacterium]|nr:GNAT family N-acetyltransferase [Bacteroidota bacterium]
MIRPLRREDRERLQVLVAATGKFTGEEVAIALELIDAVLDGGGQKDYIIRVSESDGNVEGYYCVGPTPATEGTFDLYWIAVDPARQGKGIGTQLDDHASALVRGMGGRLLIAETSSRPVYGPTREFYLRRGYRELARIAGYYRPGDDLVVFGKYLT